MVASHSSKRWAWLRICRSDLQIAFHAALKGPRPGSHLFKQNHTEQPEIVFTFSRLGALIQTEGCFVEPALAVAMFMAHIEDRGS